MYHTDHMVLVSTMILVPDDWFFYLANNVIGCSSVSIPICVNIVGTCTKCSRLLFWDVGLIKLMLAHDCSVIFLAANLAEDQPIIVVPHSPKIVAATMSSASSTTEGITACRGVASTRNVTSTTTALKPPLIAEFTDLLYSS
jgi:hypothetical protein